MSLAVLELSAEEFLSRGVFGENDHARGVAV